MILTRENYHSLEANREYMGATQLKSFMECPARAMAELRGVYKKDSDAFLAGHYLDAHFEGTLDIFRAQHPELFKKDGTLLQKYERINDCINAIETDDKMRMLCTGEQQKIMTGVIEGVKFKIMIDSYLPDLTIDRKLMADFKDKWSDGEYVPWWKVYRYDIQAAIYSEIRRQVEGGKMLPFDLVAVSKEPIPDKAWVRFTPEYMEHVLDEVKYELEKAQMVKFGIADETECGECEYCRSIKKLIQPEIIGG